MYQSINLDQFREAFKRADRGNNFSHEGLEVLFDFLTEMEYDTGDDYQLDVIALCCDFTEDTPREIATNYSIDLADMEASDTPLGDIVLAHLYDHTAVAGETESTIIYQAF